MSQSSPIPSPSTAHPTFFNLAALALILLMAGLGMAYWLVASARPEPAASQAIFEAPFVTKTLADTPLRFPQSWENRATRQNEEIVAFLDLSLNVRFTPQSDLTNISLHLAPSSNSQSSATLLDSVYALRFSQKQIDDIPGLIGKPLRAEQGFDKETVWYDPLSTNPFAAKCIDLGAQNSAPNCLRTVQLSPEIIATYQFNAKNLTHWRQFDSIMDRYFEQMTP